MTNIDLKRMLGWLVICFACLLSGCGAKRPLTLPPEQSSENTLTSRDELGWSVAPLSIGSNRFNQ